MATSVRRGTPRVARGIQVPPTRIRTRRPIHPHVQKRLKLPAHIKLTGIEKTAKGWVIHYTSYGTPKNRFLKKNEEKHYNDIVHALNAKRKGKGKIATEVLAGLATNQHVISLFMHI